VIMTTYHVAFGLLASARDLAPRTDLAKTKKKQNAGGVLARLLLPLTYYRRS